MNFARTRRSDVVSAILCFQGMALWAFSIAGKSMRGFTISQGPMLDLSPSFWIAFLVILLGSVLARRGVARVIALVAMLCLTTLTLSFIEPYGHQIDSAWNVSYAARLFQAGSFASVPEPYVASYPGSIVLFGTLISATGLRGYEFIAIFVVISSFLTFLAIYVLAREVRRHIIKVANPDFEYFTTLCAIIFGPLFFVRINPAPETIGYIIALFVLFLAMRPGVKSTLLLVLCVGALVITHPLTPILLLPLVVLFSLWRPLGRSYSFVATRGALVAASTFAWLSFRSDWIITGALALLLRSSYAEAEASRPTYPPAYLAPRYYYFYGLALAAVGLLVVCTLLLSRKTRFGKGIGVSFALMTPAAVVLFGGELAPRLWLSVLILVVLCLGWILSTSLSMIPGVKARSNAKHTLVAWTMVALLVSGGTAAVASSYYADNAYERITPATSSAQEFLATKSVPSQRSYVDGFNLPVDWQTAPATSPRNVFRVPQDATFVLVTDQMRNFASLYEGKPYPRTYLFRLELNFSDSWNSIYDDGEDIVYMR